MRNHGEWPACSVSFNYPSLVKALNPGAVANAAPEALPGGVVAAGGDEAGGPAAAAPRAAAGPHHCRTLQLAQNRRPALLVVHPHLARLHLRSEVGYQG